MSLEHLHVLAMPFPGQGHLTPMLHLVRKLASNGFHVTLLNIESIHNQLVKTSLVSDPRFTLKSIPFSWSIPKGFDAYCTQNLVCFMQTVQSMETAVDKVIAGSQSSSFCCFISDYFLPWTQRLADKYKLPRVALWSGCAGWTAVEFNVLEMVTRGHVPPSPKALEENLLLVDYIPGLPALHAADIPTYLRLTDQTWIRMVVERAPLITQASWVLVDSFYELEPETFEAMQEKIGKKFVSAGPLFLLEAPCESSAATTTSTSMWSEDTECIAWLDKHPPQSVLYISFGSNALLSLEEFRELGGALESLKQPFLWVIRPGLVSCGDGDVDQVKVAKEALGNRTKQYGFITTWSPQLQVLSHPAVAVFLTHCGWNSMLESIASGVPMLGWPCGAEQNLNCKLMAEVWKVGMRVKKSYGGSGVTGVVVRKEEIIDAIKTMIGTQEGEEVRSRALMMKRIARSGSSCRNMEAFMEELKRRNQDHT